MFATAGNIYSVASDGGSVPNLVSVSDDEIYEFDSSPDISPDGSRIVYATTRHTTARDFEIETSRLDGSDRRRLTDNGMQDVSPVWSPDGSRIAFARVGPGTGPVSSVEAQEQGGIYSMAADGTDSRLNFRFNSTTPSTIGMGLDLILQGGPRWSPDEKSITLVGYDRILRRTVLYAVDPYDSDPVNSEPLWILASAAIGQVVENRPQYDAITKIFGTPEWSPDGRSLAFFQYFDLSILEFFNMERDDCLRADDELCLFDHEQQITGPEGWSLWTIGADGSEPRKVMELGSNGPMRESNLSWSPDGKTLLLPLTDGVHVVNADGSGFRRIDGDRPRGRSTLGSIHASWSPDGSKIAIVDGSSEHYLITVSPDGLDQRVLVKQEDVRCWTGGERLHAFCEQREPSFHGG